MAPVSCSNWDGTYHWASEATAHLYGFDSGSVFKRKIKNAKRLYIQPARRENLLTELEEHGRIEGFEFQAVKRDEKGKETKIWVSENVQCYRMRGAKEGPLLLGTFADITERKNMES